MKPSIQRVSLRMSSRRGSSTCVGHRRGARPLQEGWFVLPKMPVPIVARRVRFAPARLGSGPRTSSIRRRKAVRATSRTRGRVSATREVVRRGEGAARRARGEWPCAAPRAAEHAIPASRRRFSCSTRPSHPIPVTHMKTPRHFRHHRHIASSRAARRPWQRSFKPQAERRRSRRTPDAASASSPIGSAPASRPRARPSSPPPPSNRRRHRRRLLRHHRRRRRLDRSR